MADKKLSPIWWYAIAGGAAYGIYYLLQQVQAQAAAGATQAISAASQAGNPAAQAVVQQNEPPLLSGSDLEQD